MLNIIMIALLIESIVSAIKPLWNRDSARMSAAELVSIGLGVLLAVTCRIDMFAYVADVDAMWMGPAWVQYVFYALTGVAIGRGPSFVWDLWNGLRRWREVDMAALLEDDDEADDFDPDIDHWSLEQLRDFCRVNGIDAFGCTDAEDYRDLLEQLAKADIGITDAEAEAIHALNRDVTQP